MYNKEEKTARMTSVGADEGQPIQITNNSIPQTQVNCNGKILETKSMTEIYDTVYLGREPLIDGLL